MVGRWCVANGGIEHRGCLGRDWSRTRGGGHDRCRRNIGCRLGRGMLADSRLSRMMVTCDRPLDGRARTLRREIAAAYDLAKPGDAVVRLMSLYPATGTIVSASGGRVSVSRDSLEAGVRAFWDNVGKNMRDPTWTWGAMHVDVLARDAAVLTTTYRVPHLTPRGVPHVIAGAWTAVFQRRAGKWVIIQEHLSDVPQ